MLVFEEAQKRIEEVGCFSNKLEEVLLYLLKETQDIRETATKENEARKADIEKKCKDLERSFQDDSNRLKEIIKKENEERQRDMKDIEAYVKKENAERKKESNQILEKIKSDEEKRKDEAKALEDKIAKEKKELEDYLKKDALEHKQKMESENKAMKDKLDRESNELKKKMSDGDEEKAEEMKILQNRLDNERKMLNDKMEREKAEIAEELERAETERKNEATKLKNKLEEDKKEQDNGVVQMFERLKGENENRKSEIHGLKDILVRENERIQKDQIALGHKLDTGLGELDEKLVRETNDCRNDLKKAITGIAENINTDKKELKDKLENEYTDLKRKVELETNDMRDKMQFDKKAMVQKFEEVEDERQKEAKLIRAQLQKEREETKDTITHETKNMQNQMDDNMKDILDVVKKEKHDRERDVDHCKKRIDEEKEELKLTIDRDRDNMTKKLNEEHDQRRIEQLEVQQRLENTEKSGKNDMVELFNRVKRYEEEARIDNDEVRQAITRTSSGLEERALRDKKELHELLDHEAQDLSKRVDKCNLERINDSADVQGKIGMLGKSASRHLEHLKHALQREVQNLIELAGKPGSVMFSAHRDEGHADGGECYVTFSACNVNLGNGFIPKSGMFQCPEPGMYLFTVTVCTYDGKKCLLILRKNEKDVCALIDQDGNENRGKTMISQTCLLELDISDRVQVYAGTGTGYTDTKNSHYTQFTGVLMRASQETFKAASRSLAEEEDVSIGEGGSFRGFTPMRGFTPGPNGDISRRGSRKEPRRNNNDNKAMSPPPIQENGASQNGQNGQNGHLSPEDKPVRKERKKLPDPPMEIKEESPAPAVNPDSTPQVNGTLTDIEVLEEKKPQQSYLALTGLGGPDRKTEAKPNQGTPTTGRQAAGNPNSGFYSFLKR